MLSFLWFRHKQTGLYVGPHVYDGECDSFMNDAWCTLNKTIKPLVDWLGLFPVMLPFLWFRHKQTGLYVADGDCDSLIKAQHEETV